MAGKRLIWFAVAAICAIATACSERTLVTAFPSASAVQVETPVGSLHATTPSRPLEKTQAMTLTTTATPVLTETPASTLTRVPTLTFTPVSTPVSSASPTAIATSTPGDPSTQESMFSIQKLPFKLLDFTGSGGYQNILATGDTNHDGAREILVLSEVLQTIEWDGTQFQILDVADLLGIPFSSCHPDWCDGTSPNYGMGPVSDIVVADLNEDGVSEVAVGTAGYHALSWGSFFAFDWEGEDLRGQYANYCLGRVYRLDVVSTSSGKGLLVSTAGHTKQEQKDGQITPPIGSFSSQETCASAFMEEGMVSWRGLFYLNPVDYSIEWGMTGSMGTFEVAQLTDTSEWFAVRKEHDENRFHVYLVDAEGYSEVEMPIEIPWTKYQVERVHQLRTGDLDGDKVNELIASFRDIGGTYYVGVYRWNGEAYQSWWETEVVPFYDKRIGKGWSSYRLWVGDVDTDGSTEILTEDGDIYKWDGEHFVMWTGLREIIEKPERYDSGRTQILSAVMENIDDGKLNEIIILTREMPYNFVYIAQMAQ